VLSQSVCGLHSKGWKPMRVIAYYAHNDLREEEWPKPDPGRGEVRVRVKSVCICASDLTQYQTGGIGDSKTPVPFVLGHEAGGIVDAVGAGVTHLPEGTPVAIEPAMPAAMVPALFLLLCFAGVLLFSWRFSPIIDFRTNPIWKRKHRLRLTPDAIFLEPPDGGKGTELPWRSLRRVLETGRAFVMVYRSEREFLIVPRRVLGAHEAAFRRAVHASFLASHPPAR
jgi:hypothetical protein